MQGLFIFLMITVSLFMILLIMIQRGKGGGLAGAFGGMGGQSAFGTKAGDTFTKITVWTALLWFALCVIALIVLGRGLSTNPLNVDAGKVAPPSMGIAPVSVPETTAPAAPETTTPAPAAAEKTE